MPQIIDPHTDLRRTRLILIGAALLLSLGMGIRQSFGLFLTPVTRDLAVTAADFTLAVAVQNIVWGISQAPIGAIADRFGLRLTMMAGAAIYVVGLAIMAAAGGVPALIVSGALIGVALSCIASSLAMTAVARRLPDHLAHRRLGRTAPRHPVGATGPERRRQHRHRERQEEQRADLPGLAAEEGLCRERNQQGAERPGGGDQAERLAAAVFRDGAGHRGHRQR